MPHLDTRPLKVAMVTDSLDPSGVGEHMLTLGQALRRETEVGLAFVDCPRCQPFLQRAKLLGLRPTALYADQLKADFRAWLEAGSFDLAHIHAGVGWEGLELIEAASRAGRPVVRTEHLPYVLTDPDQEAAYRATLSRVDRLVTVSEASFASYAGNGVPVEQISVVRNGLSKPHSNRTRVETREDLGVAPDELLVLTVARFTEQKGHVGLIEALRLLRESRVLQPVRTVLVGDGPLRIAIEAQIAEANLEGAVILLGERADVGNLLSAADLFVLPSRFEGLPLAILEAMAFGLPVVATDIGGTREAVGPDYDWLAGPGSPEDLARLIGAALADASGRAKRGAALSTRFERHFHADRMADETLEIYQSLFPIQLERYA